MDLPDSSSDEENALLDLADPVLEKASLKIQAVVRGHNVRNAPGEIPSSSEEESSDDGSGPAWADTQMKPKEAKKVVMNMMKRADLNYPTASEVEGAMDEADGDAAACAKVLRVRGKKQDLREAPVADI